MSKRRPGSRSDSRDSLRSRCPGMLRPQAGELMQQAREAMSQAADALAMAFMTDHRHPGSGTGS